MKNSYLAGIAALFAIAVGPPARAADMAVKALPAAAAPSSYNWSGLYAGANFGGAWSSGSLNIPGNNFYGGLSEFIGGVHAGYNVQAGNILIGLERVAVPELNLALSSAPSLGRL